MTSSLRALLEGLIDYAGLFPPAKLPLPEALGHYLRYRTQPEAWMLGRFICPAARLVELQGVEKQFQQGPPLAISALGRGGDTPGAFLGGLQADLADIDACRERHEGRVTIDVLETKLPAGLLDGDPSARLLRLGEEMATMTALSGLSLFFELPEGTRATASDFQAAAWMLSESPFTNPAGLKVRCGGLNAEAFPSSSLIAFALLAVIGPRVPFKATAGLHHPFPRRDESLQADMHGFINLFAAGALGRARRLPPERLVEILDDTDPRHFAFSENGLRWQDLELTTQEIRQVRGQFLSFGSCSFDEPRDDLRSLHWL